MWIATKIVAIFLRITYTSDVILVVLENIYLNTSKVYSIQQYVIKIVSDVHHVGGFLHQ